MAGRNEGEAADDRFASGEWTGFYVQPDGSRRYAMEFVLQFDEHRISGDGQDAVGDFVIEGVYDTKSSDCDWRKQYIGQHAVKYQGRASHRGIIGEWRISGCPPTWSGPFFVWPRSLGDLELMFERAFVEYDLLSTPFDGQGLETGD